MAKSNAGTSFATTYVLSAAAASMAETATFPIDVIKTVRSHLAHHRFDQLRADFAARIPIHPPQRLQAQGEKGGTAGQGSGPQRGALRMGLGILKEEGGRSLFRGLAPACLRHCVYSGLRVGAYEILRFVTPPLSSSSSSSFSFSSSSSSSFSLSACN